MQIATPTSYNATSTGPLSLQTAQMLSADGTPMTLMTCDELIAYLEQRLSTLNGRIRDKMNASAKNSDAVTQMNQTSHELEKLGQGTGSAADAKGAIDTLLASHGTDGTLSAAQVKELKAASDTLGSGGTLSASQVGSLVDANNGQVDALGRIDSMNLTGLQMLVSQMSQATGLVSSMLASFNDSARAVIGNMR